jgi:hypothetical protein
MVKTEQYEQWNTEQCGKNVSISTGLYYDSHNKSTTYASQYTGPPTRIKPTLHYSIRRLS